MIPLQGPQQAQARLQQLQEKIDSFLGPRPLPQQVQGAGSFQNALNSALPADPSQFSISGSIDGLRAMADSAATKYGLDPNVFRSLVKTESGWNPQATSRVGATGLCQLMPSTAAALGVTNPTDPAQSLEGGAKYLKQMLDEFGGDYSKALAAYNAGPAAVRHAGGIPPFHETVGYVRKILADSGGIS